MSRDRILRDTFVVAVVNLVGMYIMYSYIMRAYIMDVLPVGLYALVMYIYMVHGKKG